MTKKAWRRIALGVISTFFLLVVILAVHIFIVTRPKAPDANTRIMARIDIRQDIDQQDADRITAWMYRQKGMDHVLVNPKSEIVVFTFFPIKTSANRIVSDFKAALPYKAERFLPTADQMKGGCPVAATSATYKVLSFFKNIF